MVVSHGSLASALVETTQLIMGSEQKIETAGLFIGDDVEDFKAKISQMIDELHCEDGLIVFADLFGGTPANSILMKLSDLHFPTNITCYAGVNLPILLESIALANSESFDRITEHLDSIISSSVSNLTARFATNWTQN